MNKISVIELEKKLGKKIKRNTSVLGIDAASTAGMAYIKVNKNILYFETEKIKFGGHKKGTQIGDKLDKGIGAIKKYKSTHSPVDLIVIEKAYLKLNKYVYGLLNMLAGVFYCEFSNFTKKILFYYPTEHRKLIGFNSKSMHGNSLKALVVSWVNNLGFGKLSHDEADAVMIALSGIVIQPPVQKSLKKKKKKKLG